MHLDPVAPDPPLLKLHPLVCDRDPGTINCNDDICGERFRGYLERKIRVLDPAEEGGIVNCPERGNEGCELPDKSLHLEVGPLKKIWMWAIHAMNDSRY